MPPNVQLKKAEEDIAYKHIFLWDLDLNPVAPYTQKILLKDKVSFGGKWTLEIARTKDDLNIDINFLDAGRAGRFGDVVKVTGSFAWIQAGVNGREHTFRSMQWYASTPLPVKKPSPEVGLVENVRLSVTRAQFEQESQSSGGLFDPAAHRHFRLTFQLVQAFPDGGVSSSASLASDSFSPDTRSRYYQCE